MVACKNNMLTLKPNSLFQKTTKFNNTKHMKISRIEHLGIAVKSIEEEESSIAKATALNCAKRGFKKPTDKGNDKK